MTFAAQCVVCREETAYLLTKDGYKLNRCNNCGLVFTYPVPDQAFLKNEVYSESSGYQANKASDLSLIKPRRKTVRLSNWLKANAQGKKLLDVGCSNGEFIYYLRSQGFEVAGVELNPRTAAIAKANGLEVYQGTLEEANFQLATCDIIYLGDVIEHVTDPRGFASKCLELLKPGGLLIISTPNLDCLWAKTTFLLYKLFKIPWSSVTPPHHTFQFSYDNLNNLLSQAGALPVKEWFDPPPRLMYELGSLHLLKKFKNSRSGWDGLYTFFAYGIYTLCYGVVRGFGWLGGRNFAMTVVYKKNA